MSGNKKGKAGIQKSPDHKPLIPSIFQAHRLEGKVENRGIKNLGHQKKKPRVRQG